MIWLTRWYLITTSENQSVTYHLLHVCCHWKTLVPVWPYAKTHEIGNNHREYPSCYFLFTRYLTSRGEVYGSACVCRSYCRGAYGIYVVFMCLLMKIAYLINVLGQLFLINHFLGECVWQQRFPSKWKWSMISLLYNIALLLAAVLLNCP